ncbi:ExbD/TolR family protein [Colwellia psychrerythraea]|uniref:Biopolymer transport protein ExbD/TolR n=1 Tax=Colwellia psychrerythraea TaxID=28229 RepID=A0A099L6M5_COLPS|nr:biopolymer transporter ExbD [Colwellia psychrerythraea]KGJ97533.1 Biopolymer transport protein ExbD/TolR [Colwellia psychrerythraea]
MMFGGEFDDEQEMMSEINMTPLVDVMLVLLIIFIITVPVLTQTVAVELPKVADKTTPSSPTSLSLVITKQGQLLWQQQIVSREELTNIFADIVLQDPQPKIQLQGDAEVPYEHVVKVMALAQKSGVESLGFVTTVL